MIRTLFRGLKSLIGKLLKLGAVVGAVMFLVRLFTRRQPAHDTETVTSDSGPPGASTSVASVAPARPATAPVPAPAPAESAALAEPATGSSAWVAPENGGTCPDGHPIKVKVSSGIYHVPGGVAYDRTVPDRCYTDTTAAEADGYRPSKR